MFERITASFFCVLRMLGLSHQVGHELSPVSQMPYERGQRLTADVMLDAFGVRFGDRLGHADGDEEPDDGFVAIARFFREAPAVRREKNRSIRLARDEP